MVELSSIYETDEEPWYRGTTVTALIEDAETKDRVEPKWARNNYHLIEFIEEFWEFIEPQPYVPGWHIEAECQHLEAVTETAAGTNRLPKIQNLLINISPRTSKSLVTSVFWPAWTWIEWPSARFLYISYSKDLSLRDSTYCRDLMRSNLYQKRWGNYWYFVGDQNVKSFYANSKHGYRLSTSVGAMATGFGGDIICADDLHAVNEDLSTTRAEIKSATDFWTTTIPSRVTNPKTTCKVIVGQRISEDDVSGIALRQGSYEYLKIPMEYEPEEAAPPTILGWEDPRTEEGEIVCPERFPPEYVEEQKKNLGHRYFAQYQQRPTTEATSLFPESWWQRFYKWPDADMFDVVIQSWDFRFGSEKESGSYVAGHLWARKGPPDTGQVFLLDRYFERASFVESCAAIEEMSRKWPGAYAKLIENKANGPAIFNFLRSKVFGLVLVAVDGRHGSKYARAEAVAMIAKDRRAWIPSDDLAEWAPEYVRNMKRFPAAPDDDTDATSQAWHHLCPPKPTVDTMREERRQRDEIMRQAMRHRNGNGHRRKVLLSRTGV